MPLYQHRPALAAILVAVIAVLTAIAAPRPAAASPASDAIVAHAQQGLGTWGGQCWEFMKSVVREATGAEVGFDYREGYLEAGAIEVSLNSAGPGDIIQIVNDAWSTPDADYPGLHTAIIISSNGDGTFEVIDSNMNWDEMVNWRPRYDPAAIAGKNGINFHIYRFGGDAADAVPAQPAVKTVPGPVANGDKARVNTPGDCLRLRTAPSGSVISCLGHGTQVIVTGAPMVADGITWVPVSTAAGTGWMAADFLLKEAPATSAGPADGAAVKPIMKYRSFVTVAAD